MSVILKFKFLSILNVDWVNVNKCFAFDWAILLFHRNLIKTLNKPKTLLPLGTATKNCSTKQMFCILGQKHWIVPIKEFIFVYHWPENELLHKYFSKFLTPNDEQLYYRTTFLRIFILIEHFLVPASESN